VADEPGGQRPRILHIIPHDGVGGVEVAARSMAERGDLDCDFTLLLLAGKTLSEAPTRIEQSPFGAPLNPLAQCRGIARCVRNPPDVLIMSLWRSVGVAVLARLIRRRIRLVFFLNLERPVHAVDAIASRIAIAFADEVWADSAATLQARIGKRSKATRVISFVTQRREAPATPPAAAPRFVTWSRLNRQKGIDRALHFIAALVQRGIDARFDIWGPDDGEQASLEALAKELGIEGRIRFRGAAERDSLAQVAAGGSFFLQLSRYEGMAMGTVEAMQLGLVPVVTPVGEMARYVENGASGVFVDPDDLGAGVEAVAELIAQPEAYARARSGAIAYWQNAALYAEDICAASHALLAGGEDKG
jgi:glycosyltransferase involved in cell wall biosynthesis